MPQTAYANGAADRVIAGGAARTFGKAQNIKSSQHAQASRTIAERKVQEVGPENVKSVHFKSEIGYDLRFRRARCT